MDKMGDAMGTNRSTGRRLSAGTRLVGVATALAFLTACGSAAAANSPASSSSAAPTLSVAGSSVNGFATKKELAADSQNRKFVKTTLAPDDRLLAYQPEQVTEQTSSLFSVEEIAAAHKVAMLYLADEITDSILKGDNITKADKDLWWASVKDALDPEQSQEVIDDLKAPFTATKAAVYQNPERAAKGYTLEYSERDIQLLTRHIALNRVVSMERDGKRYIGFNTDLFFELPVLKQGEKAAEKVTATSQVVARQVTPGVWKIAGTTISVGSVEYSK